jgi:hypothetical protein
VPFHDVVHDNWLAGFPAYAADPPRLIEEIDQSVVGDWRAMLAVNLLNRILGQT